MTTTPDEVDAAFGASVLAFVRSTADSDAVAIVRVGGCGADWAGSTEEGFYKSFAATVRWQRSDGTAREQQYDGESMEQLWDWVVRGDRA